MTTTSPTTTTLAQDIFERAAELKRAGKPFVLATVVWSKSPTSARPGAKGIITPDGALFGWVGGSCAQPSVIRAAITCLNDGESRLLKLDPESTGDDEREGRIVAPMTCHSGGSVEVFLEPYLPPLQLIVAGESPVADTLLQLGHIMGYRTVAVRPGAVETVPAAADEHLDTMDLQSVMAGRQSAIVVATMGMYDEDAIRAALEGGASYVAVVASRRRFDAIRSLMRDTGVDSKGLSLVKAPAGIDIKASTPEEIAVSILAEIISQKDSIPRAADGADQPVAPEIALDPVCGMEVEVSGARHVAEYEGQRYYFCCPGCKARFEKQPEKYLAA
jgi:xanthine dehydrogenase accessory factor